MTSRHALRLAAVALLAVLPAGAEAEGPVLVSVDVTGTAAGDQRSFDPAIDADGRHVAFRSQAQDLAPGAIPGVGTAYRRDLFLGETVVVGVNDPPYDVGLLSALGISDDGNRVVYRRGAGSNPFAQPDVFVRDVAAGVTLLVSADLAGRPAGGFTPKISGDGRHVVFLSGADSLVANDGNGSVDVFVRDLDAGVTRLVSVDLSGTAGGGIDSFARPAISADGRFVAFASSAEDLVTVDGNGLRDVFLRDLSAGTTTLISRGTGGGGANGNSDSPAISADGRRVAFASPATDLVPGGGVAADVYVHDVATGDLVLASINLAGTAGGMFISFGPALNADGTRVAFNSLAFDLTADDVDAGLDVFVRDLEAGVTTLVSVAASGSASGDSPSEIVSPFRGRPIDATGRRVVFLSSATNLVTGVAYDCLAAPCPQVYLRDLALGTTELLSFNAGDGSTGDLRADNPTLSADGRVAAFDSDAEDLSPLDANGTTDVFASGMPAVGVVEVPALAPGGLALLAAALLAAGWRLAGRRRRRAG